MNRYLVLISVFLAVAACKTQRTIAPFVLRDSISITYKQGIEPTSTPSLKGRESNPQAINHLWNQQRIAGDNNRSYEVATRYDGKPKSLPSGGGAKSVESAESVRDLKIRVDTVFVERWHTQMVPSPPKPIPRFYKDCTKGFWVLLILLLGGFALRIMKAIYLRK